MSRRFKGGFISTTQPVTSLVQAKGVWTLEEQAVAQKAGQWPSTMQADPFFENTTLLLNGDGTNGAQNNTFLDSSTNNFTITRTGTPTQGTFSPFSQTGWSGYFNGTSSYVTAADTAVLDIATGDFTLEFWVNAPPSPVTANRVIARYNGAPTTGTQIQYDFVLLTTGAVQFEFYVSATAAVQLNSSTTALNNTWRHVAVTRAGNVFTLWVDGVLSQTATVVATANNGVWPTFIGSPTATNTNPTTGYISNVRLIKGQALYSGTFTPATSALTNSTVGATGVGAASSITGTVGLLAMQSNRFVDNSTTPKTLTPTGTPSIQAFSPFAPTIPYSAAVVGGSGYFNNSAANTDRITSPSNAAFAMGTGSFTLEAWIYPTATPTSGAIFLSNISSATGNTEIGINLTTARALQLQTWNTGIITPTGSVPLNAWSHTAVTFDGTTYRLFLNGVLLGTSTTIQTLSSTNGFAVGGVALGGTSFFTGYIVDARVLKGAVAYPTASTTAGTTIFTPPTAPLTAITGTILLLNFTNAGITDATAKNDLVTVGSAQVSTAVTKFGTGSLSFNGIGSYLTVPDQPLDRLSTSDFVIEGWVYLAAIGSFRGLISKGTSTTGWTVSTNTLNQLTFNYASSGLTGATSLSINTWYYFAVVRSGSATGNIKIYSGTTGAITIEATSPTAITTDFSGTDVMYIGADRTATNVLNGYLDDVRITRAARTITTVPSAAFLIQ